MKDNVICKYCDLGPPGCGQCSWSGDLTDSQTKKDEKQSFFTKLKNLIKG